MTSERRLQPGFGAWWFRKGRFAASHALLALLAATMLVPFAWMVLASSKPLEEVERLNPFPTRWVSAEGKGLFASRPFPRSLAKELERLNPFPSPWVSAEELGPFVSHPILRGIAKCVSENYVKVFEQIPFARYYFNSLFVAAWVTFLQCLTSSMAGYAFSRLRWRGRDTVFRLYLATLMIPGVVTMIPNYTLMVKLHLLDSYLGLIVPASFSAFGTFLMRQFMLTIPPSLDEAAAMDGASPWQVYWDVILPLARPGLITLAIFTFLGNYGSFFWPLILINSEHLRTLPIGMLYFDSVYGRQTNLIMAASVMNIVPLIILFVVTQKFIVRGIQLGAVKG